MIFKLSKGFKKVTIITFVLMGFILSNNRPVCAVAPNDQAVSSRKQAPNGVIAGQSQTPASSPQTNSQASESRESESQSQQEQNSGTAAKKPLQEFKPTEQIEVDQAVDFPYDI